MRTPVHVNATPRTTTTSASSIQHQGNNEKSTTDERMKIRHETYIGSWNVRNLRADGKLEELTHEMKRYKWNIIGLSEIRKKGTNEIQINEGHILHYISNENRHIDEVGFLINKENVKMIMNFNQFNERVATMRLHATPFNVTIIQVYAPTTDHSDEEIEHFYNKLQSTISEIDKSDIIVIQGDWNATIGKDASLYEEKVSGKYCNINTNETDKVYFNS